MVEGPVTEAGRRLLWKHRYIFQESVLAIEAEAAQAARAEVIAEIRAGVEGLEDYPGHVMRPPNSQRWLDRRAVLALLPPTEPK